MTGTTKNGRTKTFLFCESLDFFEVETTFQKLTSLCGGSKEVCSDGINYDIYAKP